MIMTFICVLVYKIELRSPSQ